MRIPDTAVRVTGANRGLGRALVEEALRRGAKRVYAGTLQPLPHSGRRVTPLTLDVTNVAQIQGATDAGIRDRYDNGWIGAGGSFDKLSAFLAKGVLS